ncbi:histidine kinase dimerization/phosphoacceptor domain-containing protein [Actinocatenispora rupis]|uniref:histidine kinase n=1 Tax=Actinocatenispora rupis TaxID=519421 RepID=A0A8J3N9C7_9ACTN|nr:histidine kinase dimerization/phosphoacceptor domain-containing protein [Actinocatenispora rupis]GID10986.1 hypothetical protein Aru02nite_18750 [Actinocatenispora rupis]
MRTKLREVSPRWTRPLLSWAGATFLTVAVTVNALPVPFGVGLGYVHPGPALVALVIAVLAALLWRAPLVALALLLAGAATVATVLGDLRVGFEPMLPAYVALCYIAASRGRRTSVAALCLAVAVPAGQGVVLIARAGAGMTVWWSQTPVLYAAVFAWLVGHTIHRSRQFAATARAQAADRAMTAERLRIARELHDMVAHSVGVIAIQAGMGSRVIRTQPDEAEQALRTIETTSREALTGLRRTLLALPAGRRLPRRGHPAAAGIRAVRQPAAVLTVHSGQSRYVRA